jgi:hypothetical protein
MGTISLHNITKYEGEKMVKRKVSDTSAIQDGSTKRRISITIPPALYEAIGEPEHIDIQLKIENGKQVLIIKPIEKK